MYELTESSDGSTKRKRQKTYDCITEVINLVDDDEDETVAAAATATADNKGVLVTSYISANVDKDQLKKPCVMFCGFSMEEQIIQEQVFKKNNFIYFFNNLISFCLIFRLYYNSAVL